MATRARRWLVTGAVAWVGISAALVTANASSVYRDATEITAPSVSDDPRFVVVDADSSGALVADSKDGIYRGVDPLGRTLWSEQFLFRNGAYGSCLDDCAAAVLSSAAERWSDLRSADLPPQTREPDSAPVLWTYSPAWKTRVLVADSESDAVLLNSDSRGHTWVEIRTPADQASSTDGQRSSGRSPEPGGRPSAAPSASGGSTGSSGAGGSTSGSPRPRTSGSSDGGNDEENGTADVPSYVAARVSLPTSALIWSTDVGRTTGVLAEDLPLASATKVWTFGRTGNGWVFTGSRVIPYAVTQICVGPSDLARLAVQARADKDRTADPSPSASVGTSPSATVSTSPAATSTSTVGNTPSSTPSGTGRPAQQASPGAAAQTPARPATSNRIVYLTTTGVSATTDRVVLETMTSRGPTRRFVRLAENDALPSVDECSVLDGGLVLVRRSADADGGNRTSVRVVDDTGVTKWSADLRGRATVSAAPDGSEVLVDTPGGVRRVTTTGSDKPLGTAYDYAVYGRDGALIQLADDGDILIE